MIVFVLLLACCVLSTGQAHGGELEKCLENSLTKDWGLADYPYDKALKVKTSKWLNKKISGENPDCNPMISYGKSVGYCASGEDPAEVCSNEIH